MSDDNRPRYSVEEVSFPPVHPEEETPNQDDQGVGIPPQVRAESHPPSTQSGTGGQATPQTPYAGGQVQPQTLPSQASGQTAPSTQSGTGGQAEMHVSNPTGSHPLRKLMFLIPAGILVATIGIAAYLTNSTPTTREPEPTVAPVQTEPPATPEPTPVPKPKTFSHSELRYSFTYPSDFSVADCNENVYLMTSVQFESLDTADDICSDLFANGSSPVEISTATSEFELPEGEVDEIEVGGETALRLAVDGNTFVTFEFDGNFYQLLLSNQNFAPEFQVILESFKLREEDPTADWPTFENDTYGYKIKHPEDWQVLFDQDEDDDEIGPRVDIKESSDSGRLHTLTILSEKDLDNVSLSATQTISSTKNLSGWRSPPTAEFRNLGGGNSEVIQGQLGGEWTAFVVIWYRDLLIQMEWRDAPNQDMIETFENIISTFEFVI